MSTVLSELPVARVRPSGVNVMDETISVCPASGVAAGVCGLAHRKGRLAPGYDADILAVDGNPLADPDAIHHIRAVYAAGVPVR